MYRVEVIKDGVPYLLHEPRDEELHLVSPILTFQLGSTNEFKFSVLPGHPYRDKVTPLSCEVCVYDGDEPIFYGRPIKVETNFSNVLQVSCEGELAYLLDSIQRPYEIEGNIPDFLARMIETHNSQVEERKRFHVGNVNVVDINSYIKRSDANMSNTMSVLQKSLVQVYGGFLRVRRGNGKKYIDYVWDYGGINRQTIRFGENLLDMKKYLNPMSMITALIPRGAEIDDGGEEKRYVSISGVNGGKDYIYEQEAVDTYGWIYGTKDFSDVTDPEILLAKSKAYLKESTVMPATITVNALDLSCVDVDIEKLKVGYWTDIISVPHNLSKRFMLSKRVINLMDSGKDVIVLGRTIETFTSVANKQQNALTDSVRRVADSASREIRQKVENATQLITGGKGGYVVLDMEDENGKRALLWRILVMNTPDKATAKNVIQINQNGIGFSTTGINGPYRNAWTIDGNLVADFITGGTMLADRIRGGSLEVGGSGLGRDGSVIVKDASDKTLVTINIDGIAVKRGEISGAHIVAGNGLFEADSDTVYIASFYTYETNYGTYLATQDQSTGMGDNDLYNFWTGWDGTQNIDSRNPKRILSHYGCVLSPTDAYTQEMYLNHPIFDGKSHYWGVGETIQDLYDKIEELESRIV